MNRSWLAALDGFWSSPNTALWTTLAGAGFFALAVIVMLFRAEKSTANRTLAMMALAAAGIATAILLHAPGSTQVSVAAGSAPSIQTSASLPALSCLDGLAGESVESACEKTLFASPDTVAAAVSYSAGQISRLAAFGKVAAADKVMTADIQALRRAIERDRYGMIAHVLTTRDRCTLSACVFFQSLTNTAQISNNMNEKLYEGFVGHYAPAWNAPPPAATASIAPPPAMPSTPTGKPMSGDFPSSASIPPISIMTPEPTDTPPPATASKGSTKDGGNARAQQPAQDQPPGAPKKQSSQKSKASAPVPLAPPAATEEN